MRAKQSQPTIEHVAREAGVSQTTVSYVLSGSRYASKINPNTCRRVIAAARRLGYRHNALAVALKRGYTDTVVLLSVSWVLAIGNADTTAALTRAAASKGISTIVHVASDDAEAVAFLETIPSLKPFGLVILWDSDAVTTMRLLELAADGLPVLDLLPSVRPDIPSISADRVHGFGAAARHLLELGHRRIGVIIDTTTRWRTSTFKLAGYRTALEAAGIEYDGSLVEEIPGCEFENGYEGLKTLLRRRPDVSAVVCMNDPVAIGAIAAAQDAGLAVPERLSVVGFGAHKEGCYIRPRLTSVAGDFQEITRLAIQELVKMRKEESYLPESRYLPMRLEVRESTGPPPAA